MHYRVVFPSKDEPDGVEIVGYFPNEQSALAAASELATARGATAHVQYALWEHQWTIPPALTKDGAPSTP